MTEDVLRQEYAGPHPTHFSWLKQAVRLVRRQPLATVCIVIVLAMLVITLVPGAFAPYDPERQGVGTALSGPTMSHLFGTDQYGRDTLSRIIYGSRLSLYVGLAAATLSIAISTFIGVIAAYFKGAIGYCCQIVVDVVQSVPPLILLVGLIVVLGVTTANVILIIGVSTGITGSRLIRATALQIGASQFVEASEAVGAGSLRVMLRHIVPNLVPTMIVIASSNVGRAVLTEASLSFLGYGIPPPAPTLGGMLGVDGRAFMVVNPSMFVFPAIVLGLIVYSLNVVGDALRDEFDPRLRS